MQLCSEQVPRFNACSHCVGVLQGSIAQGQNGVVFQSRSGDFAEWIKRQPGEHPFSEGDVVGFNAQGFLTRKTHGAAQVGIISRVAALEGSTPPVEQRYLYDRVAYVGHVPVKLRGACRASY